MASFLGHNLIYSILFLKPMSLYCRYRTEVVRKSIKLYKKDNDSSPWRGQESPLINKKGLMMGAE